MTHPSSIPFNLQLHFNGTDCLQVLEDLVSDPSTAQFHDDIAHIRSFVTSAMQMARINYLATRDVRHHRRRGKKVTP
jgi:hypothetical protein